MILKESPRSQDPKTVLAETPLVYGLPRPDGLSVAEIILFRDEKYCGPEIIALCCGAALRSDRIVHELPMNDHKKESDSKRFVERPDWPLESAETSNYEHHSGFR